MFLYLVKISRPILPYLVKISKAIWGGTFLFLGVLIFGD